MTELTAESTMQDVLQTYPAAQRALMRRYHIGGCSSCGFSPEDKLGDVLKRHDVVDVAGVLDHLKASEEQEQRLQISPQELADLRGSDTPPRLMDVRDPNEHDLAHIDGAVLATQDAVQEILSTWPKDAAIVTYCHLGVRSLEAASYLIGHGFTNVRSLRGGIDAWAEQVDPAMKRY